MPLKVISFLDDSVYILHALTSMKPRVIGYLDATSKVVRYPQAFTKYTVYFYALTVNINNRILAISEFLSAIQTQTEVMNWLQVSRKAWLGVGTTWPLFSMIVVDWSYVLINSVLFAFNNLTLKVYLRVSYSLVTKKIQSSDTKHLVHVHICCAHFIKTITKDVAAVVSNKKLRFSVNKIMSTLITCTEYSI